MAPRRWRRKPVDTLPPADTGCVAWPSCLSCPLPRCLYDLPPKRARKVWPIVRLYVQGMNSSGHCAAAARPVVLRQAAGVCWG